MSSPSRNDSDALQSHMPAGAPKGNLIERNISVGGPWTGIDRGAEPYVTLRDNLVDVDPRFIDPERQDFRLRADSPAFSLGFQPIPIERIGLYPDDLRATWPVPEPRRDAQGKDVE